MYEKYSISACIPNKELMYTIQIQTTCKKIIENQ